MEKEVNTDKVDKFIDDFCKLNSDNQAYVLKIEQELLQEQLALVHERKWNEFRKAQNDKKP